MVTCQDIQRLEREYRLLERAVKREQREYDSRSFIWQQVELVPRLNRLKSARDAKLAELQAAVEAFATSSEEGSR